MIDLEFLERLIEALDQSSLDSIEIERGGTRLRLSKSAPAPPPATARTGSPTPRRLRVGRPCRRPRSRGLRPGPTSWK